MTFFHIFCTIKTDPNNMHVMITLPERIYMNDCVVVEYKEDDYMEIEL